ncbi:Hypothetical protein GLP15_1804 [Giardia lamblia P15]|uniref:Uncharacterized protein n=1 Tax=Giardia intestinalis (strain P15) TaxID=658858 RepID=E1EW58_GIAIA|nr:Hypothetical protein GLP15_1804 [Giardia lamblia P15]
MDTGLEHACQLLIAAAQSKNFIPCRIVFSLIEASSPAEKLEKLNDILALCSLRVIRVKHKGIYSLVVTDVIENPKEHYQWLRSALTPTNLANLNEERGAYILIRIILHLSQQECEMEYLLDTLSCTAEPPAWQQRRSSELTSDSRKGWEETLERFIAKAWLLQNGTRLSSASEMAQALICEKELSKFLIDLKNKDE